MLTNYDKSPPAYKALVAKRFDRASYSYDSYALFQQIVLNQLLEKAPFEKGGVLLDIGAGTGKALPALSKFFSPDTCIALDLSNQMLQVARAQFANDLNVDFVCADAESLPFSSASFDSVFSSLAIQWCPNPHELFDELYRILKPGGYLVFSTLSEGSMPEIAMAWCGLDDEEHSHQYISHQSLMAYVLGSGFSDCFDEVQTVPMWFDSVEGAIYSLKKVGASFISSSKKSPSSPSKWKAFLANYEAQRKELGIPLSYQVSFVVVRKPEYIEE